MEQQERAEMAAYAAMESKMVKSLHSALRDLLEVVEMSETMTCRDIERHEYDSMLDDAISRAKDALKNNQPEP